MRPVDREACEAKEAAQRSYRAAQAQDQFINELVTGLIERRDRNHFGEELTVSFTPRRKRHA